MILEIGDWIFDVDVAKTMSYSAEEAKAHCDCAYCRNFYVALDSDHCKLRPMLAEFGVNAEAPEALYPYDIQDGLMLYEGEYIVFGSILRQGRAPIENFVDKSFLICPRFESDYRQSQPHFILSLEQMQLPWVIEEPMGDVISPANEPSFLKKMWDRILRKTNGRSVNS